MNVPGRYSSEGAFVLDNCSPTLQYTVTVTVTVTGMRIGMRMEIQIEVRVEGKECGLRTFVSKGRRL